MPKPPLPWYGGKQVLAPWIVGQFPEHAVYVEPFGGMAACLFHKEPANAEVYNDINGDLVALFRVARDPDRYEELVRRLQLTFYSREEWFAAVEFLKKSRGNEAVDEIERARCFFVTIAQGFGGTDRSWGINLAGRKGVAINVDSYLSRIERLNDVHRRFRTVQIENRSWEVMFKNYDTPETLFYLDPPYVADERAKKEDVYLHEMGEGDHQKLVETLLGIKGQAFLSGYDTALYDPLVEAGWLKLTREAQCTARARTRALGSTGEGNSKEACAREEVLWRTRPRGMHQRSMFNDEDFHSDEESA